MSFNCRILSFIFFVVTHFPFAPITGHPAFKSIIFISCKAQCRFAFVCGELSPFSYSTAFLSLLIEWMWELGRPHWHICKDSGRLVAIRVLWPTDLPVSESQIPRAHQLWVVVWYPLLNEPRLPLWPIYVIFGSYEEYVVGRFST